MTPAIACSDTGVESRPTSTITRLSLRWTVGRRDSLTVELKAVELKAVELKADGSEVDGSEVDGSKADERANGNAVMHGSATGPDGRSFGVVGRIERSEYELLVRLSGVAGDAGAWICVIPRSTDAGTPLILTDLPERMGLRGGTYALASVVIDP